MLSLAKTVVTMSKKKIFSLMLLMLMAAAAAFAFPREALEGNDTDPEDQTALALVEDDDAAENREDASSVLSKVQTTAETINAGVAVFEVFSDTLDVLKKFAVR